MKAVSDVNSARFKISQSDFVFDDSSIEGLDDIVFLAALICHTPLALICLGNDKQQCPKAAYGLQFPQTWSEVSLNMLAISESKEFFLVPDTHCDERFINNFGIRVDPYIRFYAGVPLFTREEHFIGTLSIFDRKPRQLNARQKQALSALARQTVAQVENSYQMTALLESELRFKTFMDNSPVLASLKDEAGRYIYVNQPFLNRCHLLPCDILGKDDFELWPAEIAYRLHELDRKVLAEGKSISDIETAKLPDGQISYWQVSKFLLQGQRRLLGCMGLDITNAKLYEQQLMQSQDELKKTLASLEILSVTDGLTGLYNRRAFEKKLEEEFERARRYNLPLSLIMLDVDNFKNFNDSFGHAAGDDLLQSVAHILKDNARANDIAARFGGDEFSVILPNTNNQVAFHLAERLRRAAERLPCVPRQVTFSIGVSELNPDMRERNALVIAADKGLYDAKRKGRNKVSNIA